MPTVSLKLALWTKLVVLGQPRWPAHNNIVPEKGIIYPKINVLNVSSGTELIRITFEYIQMLFILFVSSKPCGSRSIRVWRELRECKVPAFSTCHVGRVVLSVL